MARARSANAHLLATIRQFECTEQIERFSRDGSEERRLDRVSARITFENGIEHYSDVFQNEHPRTALDRIGGTWSEGEFETLLEQTAILLETHEPAFVSDTTWNGNATAVFEFDVPTEESPWEVELGWQHYRTPFQTRVWILQDTGEIVRVERIGKLPASFKVAELKWTIELDYSKIAGITYLLPKRGEYWVRFAGDRGDRNVLAFGGYRQLPAIVASSQQASLH